MRNVTISMDDDLVRRAKVEAARQDKSLSRFIADLLEREVRYRPGYEEAMKRYLSRERFLRREDPSKPFPTREELYDRPVLRRHERARVSERPVEPGEEGSRR